MSVEPLRRVLRAGLYNPESLPKRMKEMRLHLERQRQEGDDSVLAMLDVLEQEIERFERSQAGKALRPEGPTRETVRKLRDDPVIALIRTGTLDKSDEATIQELREIHRKITLGPGAGDMTADKVDSSMKTFIQPIEKLSKRQDAVYVHVYKPWAAREGRKKITVGKRGRVLNMTHFELVMRVIDNNEGLRKIEIEQRVDQSAGHLAKAFRDSLRRYGDSLATAESGGWVPRG